MKPARRELIASTPGLLPGVRAAAWLKSGMVWIMAHDLGGYGQKRIHTPRSRTARGEPRAQKQPEPMWGFGPQPA
jgi:hypothetical protein